MAKFFSQIKNQMRERETAQSLLALPLSERPILVYAEDDYTWNQLGPYVRSVLEDHGLSVAYVTSDPEDPKIANPPSGMSVHVISDSLASFMPKIDSPVLLTTMPDLDSFHIKRPADSIVTYAFHSLNSINMAYRPGAFDAYDVFFCTGPHHRDELTRHFATIGKTGFELFDIGYPKLDGISERYRDYTKQHTDVTTVLIAPSWGAQNVLASEGSALIAGLADGGYRVVVRPHPAFFESIYPEGQQIVADIEKRFKGSDGVVLETSITSEESFMEADLMISDWSGASFEFALGTERPVLFLDVPPKVNNPGWDTLGVIPFEDRMRYEVGQVVAPGDTSATVAATRDLLADAGGYRERLNNLRKETTYNAGKSAAAGAAALVELVEREN
jgi:YidC/Oxa1 family membrane protein insertase